ncbi:hypothetical protein ACFYRY_42235 [Streptomyces sp. NPDC005263]|uniref:hypothetical protein n=1 Tax=Streptomyces sp. NPDC005263 TaxID=3364711 RepID=UPI003685258D
MSDNLPAPAQGAAPVTSSTNTGALKDSGGGFVSAVAYGVQFTLMVAQLASAGLALRGVGARVRSTYRYIGDCAKSVDHLADLAAKLSVDPDTIGEHRDAATVMRASLARAQRMANTVDEMSVMFDQAKAAHQGDYGAVNDVATSMPVDMANRNFYRNR